MPGAETADLAALLMEWKERSGLSYGVLAKRLHMSASTLHRYCRGEALPPEFATVERFARVCRATPEEHAEAHRRWITADTLRQRERERKGARAPHEAPAPPVAPAPPRSPRRRYVWAALGAVAAALAAVLLMGLLTGDDEGGGDGDPVADAPADPGDDAPLAVTTRPYAADQCSGHGYLVDLPPSQVPPPPTGTDAAGWVGALDAVPAGRQLVELAVQGTGSETVVLRDLRVRVTDTGDPLPWQLYGGYAGCGGGPVTTAAFDVDLDAAAPSPSAVAGQEDLPLWVDERAPVVFSVEAHTDARTISWYLELDWSSGERSGTLRIDDDGRPFRTSAVGGQNEWGYLIGGTEWIDADTGAPATP